MRVRSNREWSGGPDNKLNYVLARTVKHNKLTIKIEQLPP